MMPILIDDRLVRSNAALAARRRRQEGRAAEAVIQAYVRILSHDAGWIRADVEGSSADPGSVVEQLGQADARSTLRVYGHGRRRTRRAQERPWLLVGAE
jgi:hypothetical protein